MALRFPRVRSLANRLVARSLACVAAFAATTAHADITAPTALLNRQFGADMSFANLGTTNYLAVSCVGVATPGSVFIFRRTSLSNTWTFETELLGTTVVAGDQFGYDIELRAGADGTLLLAVGSPSDSFQRGAAHIFRRSTAGTWTEEAKLVRADEQIGDWFGSAVAIAPDLSQIAISAEYDYPTGCGGGSEASGCLTPGNQIASGRGIVLVYKKVGATWTLSGTASSPIRGGLFDRNGASLAYGHSGSETPQLLIGAPDATNNGVTRAGEIRVVRETSPGNWTFDYSFGATFSGTQLEGFGESVQVSGARAVVGAPRTDVNGLNAVGRAVTLKKVGTTWSVDAILTLQEPTLSTANAFFGSTVAIDGDMVAVGTSNNRAFLYRMVAGITNFGPVEQLTYPTAQSPNTSDGFGRPVAVGAGQVAIGLVGRDVGGTSSAGAVSLFDAFPGKFGSDDPSSSENFGSAAAIGNQRVIVGVPNHDGTATNQGRVEIFEKFASGWFRILTQTATDPAASAFAGRSVAMTDDGLRYAFGAPGASSNAGAVYSGVNTSGTTFALSKLAFASTVATAQAGEALGASVAMTNAGSTRWIVAGAPNFDSGTTDRGRVLIWRNGTMHQAITNPVSQTSAFFGSAVAIEAYTDGTVDLVIGSPRFDATVGGSTVIDSGAIYIYRKAPLATTFSILVGPTQHGTPAAQGDYGARLSLKKSRLAIGCPGRANPPLSNAGAVFAWTRSSAGVWSAVAGGLGGSDSNELLGAGVSTNGTSILVGIPGRSATGNPNDPVGRAQLLDVSGSALVVAQTFSSTDSRRGDAYGFAVALGTATNSPTVIGCSTDANGDIGSAGSAYGFLSPENACASDIDGDFDIGATDLSLLLANWGVTGEDASGFDINLDGIIDAGDLSLLLANWGGCGQ